MDLIDQKICLMDVNGSYRPKNTIYLQVKLKTYNLYLATKIVGVQARVGYLWV